MALIKDHDLTAQLAHGHGNSRGVPGSHVLATCPDVDAENAVLVDVVVVVLESRPACEEHVVGNVGVDKVLGQLYVVVGSKRRRYRIGML